LALPSQSQFVQQLIQNYIPTAVGTLIEPVWVVMTRNLGMLQPFESLRKSPKTAAESLNLDYTSLPPQFLILKSLRNGHTLLASLSCMTLLAHFFSVAMSGLFLENLVIVEQKGTFNRLFEPQFVPLNGSAGPFNANGENLPFYALTSNVTAHTPFPAFSDSRWFHSPYSPSGVYNSSWNQKVKTLAIGGSLDCITPQYDLQVEGMQSGTDGPTGSFASLTVSLINDKGINVTCVPRNPYSVQLTDYKDFLLLTGQPSNIGPNSAFELNTAMDATINSSIEDARFCREHVSAGWVRGVLNYSEQTLQEQEVKESVAFNVTSTISTLITCRGKVHTADSEIIMNDNGIIQEVLSISNIAAEVDHMFTSTASDFLAQMHYYTQSNKLWFQWHNDSLPSDFNNYLMGYMLNSSSYLDAKLPPPAVKDLISSFSAVYSAIFAVVLSQNKDVLFYQSPAGTTITGSFLVPQTRIFLSTSLLIIAETILLIYIITAAVLFLKRPWRVLPRLPTTLASVIAFFAASQAVADFEASEDGIDPSLTGKRLYSFGRYVGTDGEVHTGVERYENIKLSSNHKEFKPRFIRARTIDSKESKI
jgi:hypothetical protein